MSKIKTGVLGYGFSGKIFQCPFIFAHDEFELHAVVERHGDNSKKDYPDIILYNDYMDLLKNDDIELVIISTPNHLHFEQAKLALEYNKHVLIEKPYTSTHEEALELNKLAKEKNLVCTVYQNRRFDGDFLTIKKLLEDGITIYEFEAVWDRFVPEVDDKWQENGLAGNSLLFDLGPHFLDQALALFGEPEQFHKTLHKLRKDTKMVDYFMLELLYKDKIVHLKSTMVAAKGDIRYKVHTSNGTYHFYVMGEQEHQLLAGMKPDDKDYGDNAIYHHYDNEGNKHDLVVEKGNYMEFFTELYKAIRFGKTPVVSGKDAARVIELLSK